MTPDNAALTAVTSVGAPTRRPPRPHATPFERVAVIGGGIAGMTTAHGLAGAYDVTLFEARSRIGGHTHTRRFELDGERYAVDTGFIVFNERTYPNFCRLLDRLGVASEASDMSFSVRDHGTGFEYCGTSPNTLYAQRRNLFRPSFHRMLMEIARFNERCRGLLDGGAADLTLGDYVAEGGYSRDFVRYYLEPMTAAVWSSGTAGVRDFPAETFVRFFANHGFLDLRDRPVWRVVEGGSDQYIDRLTAPYRSGIRLAAPIESVKRAARGVEVTPAGRPTEHFDHVVICAHADQALRMLADPTPAERSVLGAIAYKPNDVLLHTDGSLLPRTPRARASWNYHLLEGRDQDPTVTYHMNRLQSLQAPHDFCVTLNLADRVQPDRVISRHEYAHPVLTPAAIRAQTRKQEISGVQRTWFGGAYWGYGFHEDGVNSALAVLRGFARSPA